MKTDDVPPEGTLARFGYEWMRFRRTVVEEVFAPICTPFLRWLNRLGEPPGGGPPELCPRCDRRRQLPPTGRAALRTMLNRLGLTGEMVDPGGRVLSFSDGRQLRVSDQCESCDFDKIREFADGA